MYTSRHIRISYRCHDTNRTYGRGLHSFTVFLEIFLQNFLYFTRHVVDELFMVKKKLKG
jgi:hypothetical protein